MQDEIAAARRRKRRKYHLKRLVRFLLALVIVFVAVVLANTVTVTTWKDMKDGVRSFFTFSGGYPTELGSSAPIQAEQLTRAYAVVTEDEFIIKAKSGADLLRERHGCVSPLVTAAGNRAVLVNRGSREIKVYNRTELIASLQADHAIVDAAVSDTGTLIVLSSGDRFMSQLSVYENGKYEKVMSWHGVSGFPIICAVSENGASAAVASLSAKGGKLYTIVTSLNLKSQTERYEVSEIEGLCAGLICGNDGSATVVTDLGAVQFDAHGDQRGSYVFGVSPLVFVAHDKGSRIALGFGDNSRSDINSAVVLDDALEEICVLQDCGEIKDMYLSTNRVYILGSQTVSAYSFSGELQKVYDADPRAIDLIEFSGVIEILPDRAQQLKQRETEEENDVADS